MAQFDDWNTLAHHGIKGQKWGVRRFQNPDGTLTEEGKRHIAKSGTYMNPNLRQRRVPIANRDHVRGNYIDEWNRNHDKMYIRPHVPNDDAQKKLWDKYKDKYASATLKDLKMKDTKAARKSVQEFFSKTDFDYEYSRQYTENTDDHLYSYRREWEKYRYSPRVLRKMDRFDKKAKEYGDKHYAHISYEDLSKLDPSELSKRYAHNNKVRRKVNRIYEKKRRYANRH